jgi:ketosteroid isomerase-like protein
VITASPAPDIAAADHVALARSGYDSFAAGDIPAVLALFDDALVWSTLPSIPVGGVYSGPAGVGEFFGRLPELYAELNVMPERFIDAGDTVVVQGTHRGRTVNGTSFEAPFVHVWTWRGGKATSFTEVMDSATVVGALGGAIPAQRTAVADSPARTGSSA